MTADSDTILITLIQQLISIFGFIFNLAVVWITFKNKNLQNSYGYLLAIYSLCEALLESATFLPTVLTLIDIRISLLSCFYVSALQTIWAGTNAAFALLFISFDRTFAMIFPIFYRSVVKRGAGKFVFGLNSLSSGYIFTIIYFDWLYVLENRQTTVYCDPGDQMGGAMLAWGFYNLSITYILTIIIYIILGIYIKFSRSTDNQMAQNRRIYKTLAIVMCVIFFFYFMGSFGAQFIIPLLTNDPQMYFVYFRLFAQLITIAGAINAPVLYFCSTEYRNTMNQQFPFIFKMLKACHLGKLNASQNVIHVQPSASANTTQPSPAQNRTIGRTIGSIVVQSHSRVAPLRY